MSRWSTVHAKFWDSARRKGWDERTKLLALYLLTSRHGNIAGAMPMPLGYMAADLGWGIDTLSDTLSVLVRDGFATYCERSEYLVLNNRLAYDPPRGPKQLAGCLAVLEELPRSHPGWPAILRLLCPIIDGSGFTTPTWFDKVRIGYRNGIGTVPIPDSESDSESNPFSPPGRDDAVAPSSPPQARAALWAEMKAQIGGKNPGAVIGRWCREFGEGRVFEAHTAAMRAAVAEYVPWMTRRLQAMAHTVPPGGSAILDALRTGLAINGEEQDTPDDHDPEIIRQALPHPDHPVAARRA